MAITSINLSSLDGSNGFRLEGAAGGDYAGNSVSNAGDVNGDGFDDVIIGARNADPNDSYSGSSYVVFGKSSGFSASLNLSSLDGSNGFRLDGVALLDQSGYSVSNAGDVNGDGFDDVIIGSEADPNGISSAGSSYVVFGKASGFSATLNLSNLNGSNGFRLDGVAQNDVAGFSVSSAGDVNNDGLDDLIIGAPFADPNGEFSGSSYVVFGKSSGFSATFNLSNLNGSNGFRLDGVAQLDQSGHSVSNAGDINGDGFDDVIIGTGRDYSYDSFPSTVSYVVFGKASGFSASLNLSSLNGSNGFRLDGVGELERLGSSISNAGDVNGDGFDDLIVGAPGAGVYLSGSSYVVFGKAAGFDAAIDLSNLNGSNGFRMDGVGEADRSGNSVSTAGDVNGDGLDDLIVGAPGVNADGNFSSGSSYVVFGKTSGFNATLDLSNLDRSAGIRLGGVAQQDYSGRLVSNAGDVNGDGLADLIVGAPNSSDSGFSYVVFGSKHFIGTVTYVGRPGDDSLIGTSAAENFEGDNGNDTLIGGGGADEFHGDAGDDNIQISDFNFGLVDGGFDNDTLSLDGRGLNLNLSSINNKIKDIEAIDLTGSGDNILNLAGADLFGLSPTSSTFVVNGNAGDRVAGLNAGWVDGGIQDDFHSYTQGALTLLIDVDVRTDPPFGGVINLSDLNGTNGFRLDGVGNKDFLGDSVSSAGDVNDDGFDDVIIGARGADANGSYSGSSYVVFGKSSGFNAAMDLSSLNGNNGFRLDGEAKLDESGHSVSNAGDVNGDGFDDLIIGAPSAHPNDSYSGSSYVVFGKSSGFSALLNLSSLDGSSGFRLDGAANEFKRGSEISSAGDVNGDGFDDVIIGTGRRYSYDSIPSTVSYVVFGKASGFDAVLDVSTLDGSNGFRLDAGTGGGTYSNSISSAGDINGDGYDDLILGITRSTYFGTSIANYVIFGKASGFNSALNLSSLDGSNGFRLGGVEHGSYGSETSVSGAGDINGDGLDDLIVGSRSASENDVYYAGSSYVVFGKTSGFSATMDLSSLNGNNGFRLDGVGEFDRSGHSVSNAGDVNGDGFDDLIVSAPGTDPNGESSGSSYVVFGKASGFDATLNLSTLSGSNGVRLDGVAAGDSSGSSVSGAGDVNGDGFDDLIVGASGADPNGEDSGSSYVIFGRSDFGSGGNVIAGTPGDDVLKGTAAAEHFKAGAGDDHIIGQGGADVFEGGTGNDKIRVADLDFASVDGGAGNDVLHLSGNGLNLNLADSGDNISGIETICLYGKGDNTLTLTAADLLNLSDTTNTLRVNGNTAGHIIVEDGGWVDGGSRGSGYYHVYTHDDAVLLVGHNLTVDFV